MYTCFCVCNQYFLFRIVFRCVIFYALNSVTLSFTDVRNHNDHHKIRYYDRHKARRKRLECKRSVGGNTRHSRMYLLLLECSSRFLIILQQKRKRAQSSFLICLMIRNSLNSPHIALYFPKQTTFSQRTMGVVSMLYSH